MALAVGSPAPYPPGIVLVPADLPATGEVSVCANITTHSGGHVNLWIVAWAGVDLGDHTAWAFRTVLVWLLGDLGDDVPLTPYRWV